MKAARVLLQLVLCLLFFVSSSFAQDLMPIDRSFYDYHTSPRYRPSESHPLRTVGYILHPIGWAIDEVIYRPMSYWLSSEPKRKSIFGYREPFDYKRPFCFFNAEKVPNCATVAPFTSANVADYQPATQDSVEVSLPMMSDSGSVSQVYMPDVAFDFNSGNLNALGQGRVRQIAALLSSSPEVSVVVAGHTDAKGGNTYNEALGLKRAQAVIAELTELGVDSERLTPVSRGESEPVFTDETEWADAVNRRVQFTIGAASSEEDEG